MKKMYLLNLDTSYLLQVIEDLLAITEAISENGRKWGLCFSWFLDLLEILWLLEASSK